MVGYRRHCEKEFTDLGILCRNNIQVPRLAVVIEWLERIQPC